MRRVPRALHPVRHPPAVRRRRGGQGGAPPRRQGLPRGHVLREPGRARHAEHPHRPTGTRCSRRAPTTRTVLCCHIGSSSKAASTSPDAPPPVRDEPVVGHGDLHPRRPAVGRLLAPLPRPEVLAHRGRHRLDPVLPLARRAHPRPAQRLDAGRAAAGPQPHRAVPRAHPRVLHQRPRRREAARRVQPARRCAGSPTTRTPTARGPTRPRSCGRSCRTCPRTSSTNITHRNAMRHYQFDPFSVRPPEQCTAGGAARRGRPTSTPSPTSVASPTRPTATRGAR